jgi:hypothetical protein
MPGADGFGFIVYVCCLRVRTAVAASGHDWRWRINSYTKRLMGDLLCRSKAA